MSGMKQRLRAGETLGGYVAAIPSAVSVQAIAAAGRSRTTRSSDQLASF